MSDIARKTLPSRQASKHGHPGTPKTPGAKQQPEELDKSAPRSAPSPPADIGIGKSDQDETTTATSEEEYTHRAGKDENDEVEESLTSEEQKEEEEDEGPIKLKDDEKRHEIPPEQDDDDDESYDHLKDVESEPVKDIEKKGVENEAGEVDLKKPEEEATSDTTEKLAVPDVQEEVSSKKSDVTAAADDKETDQLTEQAKQVFDNASENQPTDEARDAFLQAASGKLAGMSSKKSDVSSQKQDEDQATVKTDEDAVSEVKDKAAGAEEEITSQKEGSIPAAGVSEKTPSEGIAASEKSQPAEEEELNLSQQGEPQPQATTDFEPDQHPDVAVPESQVQNFQQQEQDHDTTQAEDAATEGGETAATHLDFSILKNGTVNKLGNVISPDKKLVGRVVSGILSHLIGKSTDENGDIWSSSGQVIGKAEPISDSEREEMLKEPAPFESFPDAVVDGNGMVVSDGEWIGKVIEGDIKVLRGKSVDADGDILDKAGNVIGKAERWEPEPEEEEEVKEIDNSLLAGKRVNKAGNVVDSSGTIYGRVVEGDVKRMVGRMCDKNGNILSESGDVLGRAELVPEGEREGVKEGPFAELEGCTVAKDGTVVTPSGDVVGRLTQGDGKILYGRSVDEDGDVLDRNGNVIGKAERWEPEVQERAKNPMTGRKVNKEGNVVDADGNIIGKLTSGDLQVCSGKEIDDDGDVVDYKGTVIGHCSLLEDIPKEEGETEEEKEKRERAEQDKKLAIQMSVCIEQCLDKIRPICKMITEKIDKAERTPEDERDEEQLVREVRPLIEEGGRILTEAKGIIKGLDPDGRISANAKHKTAAHEATPEEYHLADVLKDLTGDVTQCIENSKKKLEDMPHAKKELNPLWGLLNEPLFQILAAVGLLLSGVLNLVGRLVSLNIFYSEKALLTIETVERTWTRWSCRWSPWNTGYQSRAWCIGPWIIQ
ncbi:hypothetical protein QBC38DRAFT_483159 [Podospora fimiseda]|uniref:DUF6987 domain-containing protein n=1 Tax=Podospora fimiseda TaxID=252190 RepID=A0AAN7GUX0_9PEZI|nr:hypothetical protein QBC38DRAFT_483159 [Podospora fimiseda]